MAALRDLQHAVQGAILAGPGVAPHRLAADGPLPSVLGLAIHRNTIFTRIERALAELYPVTRQLVGNGFFAYATRSYVEAHPPCTPMLADYGEGFPGFLERFGPARTVPCLGAVARLELARHQAQNAADAPPLVPGDLARVARERLADIRFELHPSMRLVRADYPVQTIWEAHQREDGPDALSRIGAWPEFLLVGRPRAVVEVLALTETDFAFTIRLATGDDLATAALAVDGDIQAVLTDLLRFGAFAAFSLPGESP